MRRNWQLGQYLIAIVMAAGICAGFFLAIRDCQWKKSAAEMPSQSEEAKPRLSATKPKSSQNQTLKPAEKPTANQIGIKPAVNLDVPFTSQAPYAVWDQLHNEACEEEAVITVNNYLAGGRGAKIAPAKADRQIKQMVDWEIRLWGAQKDLTAAETVKYLAKEYSRRPAAEVKSDFSIDDIKRELSAGRPVIVPAAGRLLGNPNFKRPGPIYHMVVIVGYDDKGFICNDPGTRKGYKYRYTFDRILYATHDWNGSADNINNGQQVYMVLN